VVGGPPASTASLDLCLYCLARARLLLRCLPPAPAMCNCACGGHAAGGCMQRMSRSSGKQAWAGAQPHTRPQSKQAPQSLTRPNAHAGARLLLRSVWLKAPLSSWPASRTSSVSSWRLTSTCRRWGRWPTARSKVGRETGRGRCSPCAHKACVCVSVCVCTRACMLADVPWPHSRATYH